MQIFKLHTIEMIQDMYLHIITNKMLIQIHIPSSLKFLLMLKLQILIIWWLNHIQMQSLLMLIIIRWLYLYLTSWCKYKLSSILRIVLRKMGKSNYDPNILSWTIIQAYCLILVVRESKYWLHCQALFSFTNSQYSWCQ